MHNENTSSINIETLDENPDLDFQAAGKLAELAEEVSKPTEHERRLREKAKSLEKAARRENGAVRTLDIAEGAHRKRNIDILNRVAEDELGETEFEEEPLSFEELSSERDALLEDNAYEYYKIGAMNFFAKGHLTTMPGKFIKDGFNIKDGERFREYFEATDDYEAEGNFSLDTSDKASIIADGIDEDKVKGLEKGVILSAIKRGCFIKANAYTEEDIEFSLPTEQPGLVAFMKNYDVDPKSESVRRLSYSGFSNIIKDMANVSTDPEASDSERKKSLDKGMDQLNWYFDNFGYYDASKNSFYEFLDRMHGQYESMDEDWQNIYQQFLNQRPEYSELFEYKKDKDAEDKLRISKVEEVDDIEAYKKAIEAIMNDIRAEYGFDDTHMDILREVEPEFYENRNLKEGEKDVFVPIEAKQTPAERQFSFILKKIHRFLNEVDNIRMVDPYASLYIERFDEDEGKENPLFPYLVVRFGNEEQGTNNVYAEATSFTGAFYAWKGQGDKEAWREVFSGSKGGARAREEVRAFNHYDRFVVGTLDKMYDRIHTFAPYPMPYRSSEYVDQIPKQEPTKKVEEAIPLKQTGTG